MLGATNEWEGSPLTALRRGTRKWAWKAAWGFALAGVLSTATTASAQRVERGSAKEVPAITRTSSETPAAPATGFSSLPVDHGQPAPTMTSLVNAQPEGWEMFIKGGAVFSLGDGFFEKKIGTGWTVQMGLRQPLLRPADRPWVLFAEYGAGYTANPGLSRRPVTTSGIAFFPNDNHVHVIADFYDTQLVELQRAFVQGAMGWYYYPEFANKPGERLFHVNARLGLRAGGMRTIYANSVQLGLRSTWEIHAGPNGHGHSPNEAQYFPDAKEPELFFSTFGSFGIGMTNFDAKLFGRKFADVTFGAEIEIGHEWFDAGAYGHGDPGFGSYTPMLSLAFSF